ncbi:MAG: radical SAM protein [Candidatus Omnitrophica bacterium]|nr:radical SAM protein [Candidatus Omnitrophota bacterium]
MGNKNNFRVLLVYANAPMEPLMPLGVACLATALREAGFDARLFDTTFYKKSGTGNSQDERALSLQIKAADYSSVGIKSLETDPVKDFAAVVADFKPDLIGLSCVELTYTQGLRLLDAVKGCGIPVVVGGCFATFSPEEVISCDLVDYVCVGEGEDAIVELSRRISSGVSPAGIPNLWMKEGGRVTKCAGMKIVDIESAPIPRFDIFDPKRIYRAMAGRIYRMVPIEFSRGCPYQCTYCSAPSYARKFSGSGRWLRFKTIGQVIAEIDFYIKEYDAEYFYFISETFLAMPAIYRREFYDAYKKYKRPFWFNTRPETITEDDIKELEDIGCHRISIGVESGNEEFRTNRLKRHYSNEDCLKAVDIVLRSKIQLSVNNMLGFPDETREMVFDTIELNRKFKAKNRTVSIFQPFRGTELYDYCTAKGYLGSESMCAESFATPLLDMPSLSQDEIKGLYRTFNLYVNADKSLWPHIKKAESLDEEGDRALSDLIEKVKV